MVVSVPESSMTEVASTGVIAALGINGKLFLAQLINFALVVFVVWRFVFRPLGSVMDKRAKKINEGLTNADRAKKELAEAEEQKKTLLAAARKEARGIVEEARGKAEEEKQNVVAATKVELERQLEDARGRLKRDKELLVKAIRHEVADLVSLATEKITGKTVSPDAQKKLIEEALDAIEKETV